MPGTPRTTRACGLALASIGLSAAGVAAGLGATVAVAPAASAVEDREAVALSPAEVRRSDERAEKRAEQRRREAERRITGRILAAKNIAMAQRGDPYAYGASGPSSFDCSGLIHYSYHRAGFAVPRTSGAQAAHTRRIAKQDMRTGDLMFFTAGSGVYHAAIFLGWSRGHAMMLHSPGSGQRVQVAAAWTSGWFGGTLRR